LNQRLFLVAGVLSVGLILGFSFTVSAEENLIPTWIKNTAGWWSEGVVSDSDFVNSIQWLLDNKVLQVSNTEDSEWKIEADKLYKENQQLKAEINVLQNDLIQLLKENTESLTGNTELTEYGVARLAHISASYDKDVDRLTVSIFLTDSNAEDTKDSGNAELTILQDGRKVYSATYNFVKDDFVSWKNMFGDKRTAYLIVVNKFFPSGESRIMEYNVHLDLDITSGHWEDLFDKFWSINETS